MARRGPDWHRIVFMSSLLVALLFMVLVAANKKGNVHTLLDSDGRAIVRRAIYVHLPAMADWLGIGAN